tara:strand:- start:3773 stop:4783 length:1011 start_codon:yes stop_codon:yes gene_type:complete
MKKSLLSILSCPVSKEDLTLYVDEKDIDTSNDEILIGSLISKDTKNKYHINNCIPRFVSSDNYARSFGFQWNKFARIQLDSYSNQLISFKRFWGSTGWDLSDLKDKWILDAGSGSGRFAEIALNAGANVVAIDYSSAIDSCSENLRKFPNFHPIQADIYSLPFKSESFDFIYSLGVLQHTPNVGKAFNSLLPFLKHQGSICVDFYEKRYASMIHPKYILRYLTVPIPHEVLFKILERIVPVILKINLILRTIPLIGIYLTRLIPVADYRKMHSLTNEEATELALLDTFDWLSAKYDNPQTIKSIKKFIQYSNLEKVHIFRKGHLILRAQKASNTII